MNVPLFWEGGFPDHPPQEIPGAWKLFSHHTCLHVSSTCLCLNQGTSNKTMILSLGFPSVRRLLENHQIWGWNGEIPWSGKPERNTETWGFQLASGGAVSLTCQAQLQISVWTEVTQEQELLKHLISQWRSVNIHLKVGHPLLVSPLKPCSSPLPFLGHRNYALVNLASTQSCSQNPMNPKPFLLFTVISSYWSNKDEESKTFSRKWQVMLSCLDTYMKSLLSDLHRLSSHS